LIIGYPNRFATHVAVLGASFLKSLSASYNQKGVDEPDINEPDAAPDQYVFTDIILNYSFTTINIRIKKEVRLV